MDIMFIAILFVSAAMVGVTSLAASLDDGHWIRADYMRLVGRSISQNSIWVTKTHNLFLLCFFRYYFFCRILFGYLRIISSDTVVSFHSQINFFNIH